MDNNTIKKQIEKNDIQWIQLHFTDLIGRLRVVHIPSKQSIKNVLNDGSGFDGSSVGIATVEKSDMIAMPDPRTFLVLPHDIEKRKTPSGEIEVGVWRKMRADHLAHALGYCFVALDSTAKRRFRFGAMK